MNLAYYRNFIQIVECGTISAASRKLLIAQPALSSQLKTMERELGADLLERSARRVTLTNAGKILYEKAKLILSLQDAAEKEIQACVCGSRGTVMLGATPAMPDALFSSILTSFRRENMDVLLDLYEMSSAAIIEMLKEGGIEVGLIRNYGEKNSQLTVWSAYEEHPTAVYKRGNPWLSSAILRVPIKMLRDVPLSVSRGFYQALKESCDEFQFEPSLISICTSRAATLLWAESGLGVAIVDESLNEPRDEGDLCFRPLNGKNMQAQRLLVTHEAHQPSAVAKTFLEYCRLRLELKTEKHIDSI